MSQLQSYERCPYAYYLARVKKVWRRPAAWLAQGTAVHASAEAVERSFLNGKGLTLDEAQQVFTEAYSASINEACEDTPNMQAWFPSGPYRGAVDVERRYELGLAQVKRYLDWTTSHPEEVIWIAEDGTPGIEIGFDINLDNVQIRGYIDAVLRVGTDNRPVVRDHKTGNQPGDSFQLGVYAVALEEMHGLEVCLGDFWMGKSGKPTRLLDLTEWSRDRVSEKFQALDEKIKAEEFPPDPESSKCRFCDVSASCEYAV